MRSAINTVLVIAGLICTLTLSAQDQTVEFPQGKLRIRKAFELIETQSGLSVAYNEDLLDVNKKVTPPKSETVSRAMEILLHGTGMEAIFQGKLILVVLSEKAQSESLSAKDEKGIYVNMLEEAVVVGYGTTKKGNLTGAVSVIKADDLQDRSALSASKMLQGSVPGLTITNRSGRPGQSSTINVRGVNSINGGSPLVLIDGVEGDLERVNPQDIESISVLKDAASAAIYGSRGANGVIVVTTSAKPKADTKLQVTIKSSTGFQQGAGKLDLMNATEYAEWQNMIRMQAYSSKFVNENLSGCFR